MDALKLPEELLVHAAELLEEMAVGTRESCMATTGRDWACGDCKGQPDCTSHKRYDDLVRTAKALRRRA